MAELPEKVRDHYDSFTEQEKQLIDRLLQLGQHHLFAEWDAPGTQDEAKHKMLNHLEQLDRNCVGGLESCCLQRVQEKIHSMGGHPQCHRE